MGYVETAARWYLASYASLDRVAENAAEVSRTHGYAFGERTVIYGASSLVALGASALWLRACLAGARDAVPAELRWEVSALRHKAQAILGQQVLEGGFIEDNRD